MPPAAPSADLPGAPPSRAEISSWVEQGRYAEAAAALRTHGELAAAQELFERIWDYASALAIAIGRGDLVAQLRLALVTGELAATARLRLTLAAAPLDLQRQAAALFEQHQQSTAAGELYEAAGDLTEAQRCYEQVGHLAGSARLYEQKGNLQAAARAYERLLSPDSPTAGDPAQQAQAHRGLGRILQQLGRPEEAVRQLQQARAYLREAPPETADQSALDEIEVALVRCLGELGYPLVAHPILLAYTARHPEEPAAQTVAEFLARHSPAPVASPDRDAPPILLGRYQLTRLLGSGGMGRVYLADDRLTGHPVAVKLLPAHGAAAGARSVQPGSPADLWRRFVQEAQLLRALRHPNIVQLLDFHPEAGAQVMEYLPGGSLAQRALPLAPGEVRRVLLDVLAGLGAAHAAGVLHRDLKPHNLLCSATGTIRLGDFGAAYLQGLGATRTESFIGTLAYMAPEQLSGQTLSFATDLYALAVTAFQLLTGRLPFAGPDFIRQHLHDTPPDPRSYVPTLDESWTVVLRRALHKSPASRYASVEAMRDAVLVLPLQPEPYRESMGQTKSSPAPSSFSSDRTGEPAKSPADRGQVWLEGASPVLQTPHSTVALGIDVRIGRPVLVERFHKNGANSEALTAHLSWLKTVARLAGPGLQRILRIDQMTAQPDSAEVEVHYEVPVGPHAGSGVPLGSSDANLLRRTLRHLHAAGIAHGQILSSVVCEPTAAMLLIHGRGPLGWSSTKPPSAQDDLEQLEQLIART